MTDVFRRDRFRCRSDGVLRQLFQAKPIGRRSAAMSDEEARRTADRILLFRLENRSLLIQGQKVFYARKVNYRPGRYFFPGQAFGPGLFVGSTLLGEGVWGRWLGAPFVW